MICFPTSRMSLEKNGMENLLRRKLHPVWRTKDSDWFWRLKTKCPNNCWEGREVVGVLISTKLVLAEPGSVPGPAGRCSRMHVLGGTKPEVLVCLPEENGLVERCSSTVASNHSSWALWGAGTRPGRGEGAWVSALLVPVCACSQTDPNRAGRSAPGQTSGEFRWQSGILHQPRSWGSLQSVFAFYCETWTVSKSHKSAEKPGCTKAEDSFYAFD